MGLIRRLVSRIPQLLLLALICSILYMISATGTYRQSLLHKSEANDVVSGVLLRMPGFLKQHFSHTLRYAQARGERQSMIEEMKLKAGQSSNEIKDDEEQRRHSVTRVALPLTPVEAISRFGDRMPWWERYEILNYTQVWFLGLDANKTQINEDPQDNFGFDKTEVSPDGKERGQYKLVVGDQIGYRYEIVKYISSGSIGSVVLGRDWSHAGGKLIALKVTHIDNSHDWKRLHTRETEMTKVVERNAENHDYFSRMFDSFEFRNHQCLVFELLGPKMDRDVMGNMTLFRQFAEDLLRGMYYLHQINVAHGDLKPDNILYVYGKNNKSSGQLVKITDFGIAKVQGEKLYDWPPFIQARPYRAPEVVLRLPYSVQADMWSVGAILAELFLGFAPFSSSNNKELLAVMMEVLGPIPTDMIGRSSEIELYNAATLYSTSNEIHREPLHQLLEKMEPVLFNLISKLLRYDPEERITAEQALRHPFITGATPQPHIAS